MGTTEVPIK